jgi:AraC-like DNA-binding protein
VKPVFEHTPRARWESLHCEEVRGPGYGATWHFHPEYQITLVVKSRGYRLVGDHLSPLTAGDLVLVGANLPHVWQQDTSHGSSSDAVHAIIVRFLDDFLGAPFLEIPEMKPVRSLLQRSARGLRVRGKTRSAVAERMVRMCSLSGLARVAELLAILHLLAESRELVPIASSGFVPVLDAADHDRMARVCHYIDTHLTEPISREQAATQASLSAGAFSRFFKQRTGKTLPEYINQLRVGRACQRLMEDEAKISNIAFDCGFENLSNFNRRFREVMRMAPMAYRRTVREHAAQPDASH